MCHCLYLWCVSKLSMIFFLCLILFCRSNLLIHAGLLPPLLVSFLSRWTILELEGSDPEKSISSIESLFYLGVSLMQFSQAGPKRGKSLLSWSPGLVSCCFPQFFPCRILNSTTAWSLKPRPLPTSASPTSSSLPLKKKIIQVQQSISSHQHIYHLHQKVIISALQNFSWLFAPHRTAPPWDIGAVKALQDLQI